MAFNVYERTFSHVDAALSTYIGDVSTNVVASITPVVTTLLLIYMSLWGWSVVTGKTGELVTDGFNRIIKLTVIITLAINLGYYNTFIVNFLSNLPDHLASLASIHTTSNTGSFLDDVLGDMYDIGWVFANKALAESSWGLADIPLTLAAVALWIAGLLLTAFAAFLLVLSKMALSVLLGIGPIFIIMAMFESTKRFFDAWVGQCFNFIFIVMLVGGVLRLIVSILSLYLTKYEATLAAASPQVDGAIPAVVLAFIATLILKQVMPMASAMGGGVALSALGAGRSIGQAASNWDGRRMQEKMHQKLQRNPENKGGLRRAAETITAKMGRGNSVTRKS